MKSVKRANENTMRIISRRNFIATAGAGIALASTFGAPAIAQIQSPLQLHATALSAERIGAGHFQYHR
ncbi:MAG: twin-arginine translocation signal domain-containing protein [Rhodospirillaceae bacterium]|nr:twin-arginine translocation signal domain-containing protein [Rhodospirillaceae bacterium]